MGSPFPVQDTVPARPRVLVVEDQFMLARMVATTLQDLGYDVAGPVASLEDARKLVQSGPLNAAILNYRLDHTTTGELARELARRGCPSVFISAQGDCRPEGLRDWIWIEKPVTPAQLTEALHSVLKGERDQGEQAGS